MLNLEYFLTVHVDIVGLSVGSLRIVQLSPESLLVHPLPLQLHHSLSNYIVSLTLSMRFIG